MKNYDQLLDDVAKEQGYTNTFRDVITGGFDDPEPQVIDRLFNVIREAAERYRAQVELPTDDEIRNESFIESITPISFQNGAQWMRDQIAKQLKQGI